MPNHNLNSFRAPILGSELREGVPVIGPIRGTAMSRCEGEVLTIAEAARATRCSKTHMQNVLQGRVTNVPPLPCIRVGRRVLIRRQSLERWMDDAESLSGRK